MLWIPFLLAFSGIPLYWYIPITKKHTLLFHILRQPPLTLHTPRTILLSCFKPKLSPRVLITQLSPSLHFLHSLIHPFHSSLYSHHTMKLLLSRSLMTDHQVVNPNGQSSILTLLDLPAATDTVIAPPYDSTFTWLPFGFSSFLTDGLHCSFCLLSH